MTSRLLTGLALSVAFFGPACAAETPEAQAPTTRAVQATGFSAPDSAWRTVDPENLLLIDTAYGEIGVELYPEIAPAHVAQVKSLARAGFYDNVKFHRVIDGFMNQTGDGSKGDGTGDSDLPNIPAEFTFRRDTAMPVSLIGAEKVQDREIGIGFYKSLPIATQPTSQAMLTKDGKVGAFGLHCRGVTSMARTSDPNSANSQFFLMRDKAAHLDTQYSIWGATVMGREHLEAFKVGVVGEIPGWVPDQMNKVRIAADLPEDERPAVQVLNVTAPAFDNFMKTKRAADGSYPDICNIDVPVRTQ